MNPCSCGYYGTNKCRCSETEVEKYQRKLSGPILDRLDLQVEIERLSIEELFVKAESNVSRKIRAKVGAARERQNSRFDGTDISFNAVIPGGHALDYCKFSNKALEEHKKVIESSDLSTRSMDRLTKVARTIADLADSGEEQSKHVNEASSFVVGGLLRYASTYTFDGLGCPRRHVGHARGHDQRGGVW